MKSGNFLLAFYVFFYVATSEAKDYTDIKSLERTVIAHIEKSMAAGAKQNDGSQLKVRVRPIDPRLKLAACVKPLTLAPQKVSLKRNVSIKVSCVGDRPWSLYVNAILALERPIVVARTELPKAHVLGHGDISTVAKDIFTLRGGYATEADMVVGQELKRPLRTGSVVYNYSLRAPDIVKKGDAVTVIAQRGALQVTSPGIALSSGSKGEKIRVENQRSSRVIQGKIIGPGAVKLML